MATDNTLVQPGQEQMADPAVLYRQAMQIVGRDLGLSDWGSAVNHVSYDSDATYAHTLDNQGTGGHLNVPGEFQIESDGTGTVVRALTATDATVTNDLTVGDDVVIGDDVAIGGDLTFTSTAQRIRGELSTLTAANRLAFQSSVTDGLTYPNVLPNGTSTTAGVAVFNGSNPAAASYGDFLITNTLVRIYSGHNGASYLPLTLWTGAVEAMRIDTNQRLLVGITTAPTATNDRAHVAGGRTYLSAGSEQTALGLRYVSTTGTFYLGASNSATPDLVGTNNGGTQRFRVVDGGGLIVGAATAMAGSELLLVKGGAQVEGLLTVTSGGITVTGTGTFNDNVVLGSSNADTLTVNAAATVKDNLTGDTGTFIWKNSGNNRIEAGSTGLGFFGAAQVARPTVTGTRTGTLAQLQTVVANLLSALAAGSLGLITDSTS